MKRCYALVAVLTRFAVPLAAGVIPLGLSYGLPSRPTFNAMSPRRMLAARSPSKQTGSELLHTGTNSVAGVDPKIAVTTEDLDSVVRRMDRLASADAQGYLRLAPQIRWDKISAFSATALSQRDMRTDIALLFNFRWLTDTNGRGQNGLLLTMPAEERLLEKRLWRKTMDRSIKPMADLARHAQASATHWQSIKSELGTSEPDDPLLRNGNLERLGYPFTHAGIAFVGALSQDQLRSLADEGRLVIPWSEMSSEQQALALESCARDPKQRYADDLHPLTADEGAAADQADNAWIRRHGIDITAYKDADTGLVRLVALGRGNGPEAVIVLDTRGYLESLLPVRGSPYQLISSSASIGKEKSVQSPQDLSTYDDLDHLPFPEDVANLIAKRGTWSQVLNELSVAVDMPVFSDDFQAARSLQSGVRTGSAPASVSYKKLSLPAGLDAMCKEQGYLWWRENGALFFRSRTWFIEQLYEVPPPVLYRLSEQTVGGTKLTADAIDTVSELTLHQLEGLAGLSAMRAADGSGGSGLTTWLISPDAPYIFSFLHLWTEMSADQKSSILSKEGLAAASLTGDQAERYVVDITSKIGRRALSAPDSLRLKIAFWTAKAADAPSQTHAGANLPDRPRLQTTGIVPNSRRPTEWTALRVTLQPSSSTMFFYPLAVPAKNDDVPTAK